jgi:O-acetylhomoserine/O-acetylserine sulfhydrylase-like pyridoxal-dependent enzyme
MERSVANAAAMAEFLRSHPLVRKINYAALSTHPGADVHARQATSGGAVLSFETGGWWNGPSVLLYWRLAWHCHGSLVAKPSRVLLTIAL